MSNAEETNDTKTPEPYSIIKDSTTTENTDAEVPDNDCQIVEILPSKTDSDGGTTDQDSSTKIDSVIVVLSDSEEQVRQENDANNSVHVNNDDNAAAKNESEGKVKKDEDEGETSEPEVVTYSGYVPISNIQWDWEPPTKPAQKPPPTETVREDRAYTDKYTNVGEKARPSPYIYEIKKRKFEKKAKNKLFVGGLVFEATKDFLYDQFEKYGEVEDACVVTERGTGQSRGFGYVTFINQEDAAEAIKAIDGLRINGKTLCVEFADDPKASPRGRFRSQSPPPNRSPYRGRSSRGRGRGFPSARGRQHYDMDRYPDRDPYDRDPRESGPYHRRGESDSYYSPRDYNRPPPSRDYDRPPPFRDYDRPPPSRDYDHFPPQRRYDRDPPPRSYDDYRRPPPTYPDRSPPPRREATMKDVDFARLRVDREKVRQETSASDERRLLARRGNTTGNKTNSSSSDSSDDDKKPKEPKRRKVLPKAYMYF